MPPSATGLALQYLRSRRGLKRPALAQLLGWADASLIGRYERGDEELSEERLRLIAGVLGYPPEAVDALLFADAVIAHRPSPEPPSPVALGEEERGQLTRTAMAAAWTFTDRLCDGLARASREVKVERAFEEAGELLARLLPLPPSERRAMVAIFPEFRSWALAVRLCTASVEAAAHKVEDALELADLACHVAERVDEAPRFRLRLEGFCLPHLGNARRVANDFDGSDESFARGREHWQAGTDAEPPLLEEWRVLSLEASLRREQHRFAEALGLIDRARAVCGENDAAVARLLLKKANVLEQAGDHEAALAVLEEAAPFVEVTGDDRLLFGLLFNKADNLCRVGRHAVAADLLARVRKLAIAQRQELHLTRVLWLEGRVRSGLGERLEAIAVLEQVWRYFTDQELAYDAALSGLDLALLWLEVGRMSEVHEMAAGMAWIFKAKKIEREALAALRLFCEAAEREAATAELTRQVIAEVERVRRAASRRGKVTSGRGEA